MAKYLAPLVALLLASCSRTGPATAETMTSSPSNRADPPAHVGSDPGHAGQGTPLIAAPGHQLAAFAEGCFWGSEDTFRHVPGVTATAVGYTGGHTKNPTYSDVCSHTTGHAEAVLVEFDPSRISYDKLLHTFFFTDTPTTE